MKKTEKMKKTKMLRKLYLLALAALVLGSALVTWEEAGAIPPFARKYQTSCSTCHVMFPKLNAFGDAYRLNAYQIPAPEGDEPYIKDKPLQIEAPAWKELWPQAIWPGTIPGMPPIGVRFISDFQWTQEETKDFSTNFEFPHEIEVLFGGTFGSDLGFFGQVEFKNPDKVALQQGFMKFQDPLTNLGLPVPERAFNLWVGKLDQNLLPSYRNFTRVGRVHPLWGNKRLSDLKLTNPVTGASKSFNSGYRSQDFQPGVEVNGILFQRFGYAFGFTQGQKDEVTDKNDHKDFYYTVRMKLWGRGLDGSLPGEGLTIAAPPTGGWVDNSLQIEHFGYFGKFPVQAKPRIEDEFDRFGVALRGSYQNLDLAVGYVWGHHDRPWAPASLRGADYRSPFVKAEYMFLPWLMGLLKWEMLEVDRPSDLVAQGFTRGSLDQTRWLPGVAFLIRANVRLVVEGEIFSVHKESEQAGQSKPHNLWVRLDLAF